MNGVRRGPRRGGNVHVGTIPWRDVTSRALFDLERIVKGYAGHTTEPLIHQRLRCWRNQRGAETALGLPRLFKVFVKMHQVTNLGAMLLIAVILHIEAVLFYSVDKKSFAYKMATMNRRPLTQEEQLEAKRLMDFWREYQEKNRGATQSWLASASGLGTQGAVSQYLRGAIPLNLHALVSICRVIDADPYYVSPRLMNPITGVPVAPNKVIKANPEHVARVFRMYRLAGDQAVDTPPVMAPVPHTKVGIEDPEDPAFTLIPKVRLRLTAGISGFAVEPEVGSDDLATTAVPTHWIVQRGYSPSNLIAIHVRGESMEPTFYDGDLVVLNLADTRPIDGGVYAINYEGEPVVKRMSRDAGEWWLTSDNPDQRKYHRKVCSGDACIVVGRIVRRETEHF